MAITTDPAAAATVIHWGRLMGTDRRAEFAAAARALRDAADALAREVGHEVTNARAVAFLHRRAEVYERFSADAPPKEDPPTPPEPHG